MARGIKPFWENSGYTLGLIFVMALFCFSKEPSKE